MTDPLSPITGPDRDRCGQLAASLANRPGRGWDLPFNLAILEAVSGRRWDPVYRRGMPEALVPEDVAPGDPERILPDLERDLTQVVALVAEFQPEARVSLIQDDAGRYDATVWGVGVDAIERTVSGADPARALLQAALRFIADAKP